MQVARDEDLAFLKMLLGDDQVNKGEPLSKESLCKIKEAYNKSHDIRKFEIDLYWKRAGYFWTFITTIIAIFGLCIKDKTTDYFILSPVIANLGFITALCFFYVNLSSKYWHENWEHNVNNLEFYVSGNLYKINYSNKTGVTHSVSGVNNELSRLLSVIWYFTFIGSYAYAVFNSELASSYPIIIIIIPSLFVISHCYVIVKLTKFIRRNKKGIVYYKMNNTRYEQ